MKKFTQKLLLSVACLIFIILCAISLGAVGEDYTSLAMLLNHVLNKTLAVDFVYLSVKFPLHFLLEFTLITCFFALLSWRALLKPEYLKELFTFRRKEVYYMQHKSLIYEIKKLIPLLNKNTSLESKICFCMNPASIAIAIISCVKEYSICTVDNLANHTTAHLHRQYFGSGASGGSLVLNASPSLFRFLKGIMVIICEMVMLPLKFVQPVVNLPYWLIYFIAITIPDSIASLFLAKSGTIHHGSNGSTLIDTNLFSAHQPHLNQPYKSNSISSNKNIKYIKEQLENVDDLFS